jgi:serine phosphatase RsbU (regulator of sigma subunit)
MDIVFCCLKKQSDTCYELMFSGAQRPLWIIRKKGQFEEYNSPKISLGGSPDYNQEFECITIMLNNGDSLYIFSDGYADQFGGPHGKKMLQKRFKEKLLNIHTFDMCTQKNELEKFYNEWKGIHAQIDDVCIVGIRV